MNHIDTNRPLQNNADAQVLAMAFVNVQQLNSVYDTDTGFSCGTIYPCLNKPLMAGGMWR